MEQAETWGAVLPKGRCRRGGTVWDGNHTYLYCLGSVDAAFDAYDPIGNEFSLIAAARIACTAYAVTLIADQRALRVPKSYRQAMSSPQAEQGREAINKELSGLVALNTWDLMPIASIPCRRQRYALPLCICNQEQG